jgi:hypothetical protein
MGGYKEFLDWIEKNRVNIFNERAEYKGIKISPDTEVVQFEICMSVFIATFRIPSGFYVKGHHNNGLIGGLHSLISLIFGWWGIPWGPINTIKTIISNGNGSKRFVVRNILPSNNPNRIFTD